MYLLIFQAMLQELSQNWLLLVLWLLLIFFLTFSSLPPLASLLLPFLPSLLRASSLIDLSSSWLSLFFSLPPQAELALILRRRQVDLLR
jgi:hypothetical protein